MARFSKEKKEQIRNNILEVSRKYFLDVGYDKTSTKQIAKEVGIAEGTIFNYFPTKANLFLEIFADNFNIEKENIQNNINLGNSVYDIIYNFLYKNLEKIIFIPKPILRELGVAILNIAKKKPSLLKKLTELDYKLMDELEDLINELLEKGLLKNLDAKIATESIYSILIFEFMIYVYEDSIKKEEMLEKIKDKIVFILDAYIIK